MPIRPPIFDRNILILNKAVLTQAILESGNQIFENGSLAVQEADDRHRQLGSGRVSAR